MEYNDFLKAVDENADYQTVEAALLKLARRYGVVRATSVELRVPLFNKPFVGKLLGKPDTEYVIRYRNERLVEHDVAVKRALQSADPFSWKDTMPMANTRERRKVFRIAAEHRYHDGWVVPYFNANGGVGVTSFVGDKLCDSPEARHTLTYAGIVFYRYAQKLAQEPDEKMDDLHFTKRQSQLIYWLSHGKTDKEMAQILEIDYRTVNRHMDILRKKLNAKTRTEVLKIVQQRHRNDDSGNSGEAA